MKYIANPIEVDAWRIEAVELHDDYALLTLEGGGKNNATAAMLARMTPQVGDYWVLQSDGYVYLNPKDVFERKYRPAESHYQKQLNESLGQGRINAKGAK